MLFMLMCCIIVSAEQNVELNSACTPSTQNYFGVEFFLNYFNSTFFCSKITDVNITLKNSYLLHYDRFASWSGRNKSKEGK